MIASRMASADLVAHLVRVALGHRFGREQVLRRRRRCWSCGLRLGCWCRGREGTTDRSAAAAACPATSDPSGGATSDPTATPIRRRSTPPIRSAPFRDRFVIHGPGASSTSTATRSGRPPRAAVERLARGRARASGPARLIRGWDTAGWTMPLPGRRPPRRRRPRRATGRGRDRRFHDGQLLPPGHRRPRRPARPALHRHRPGEVPDGPVRRRGPGTRAGPRDPLAGRATRSKARRPTDVAAASTHRTTSRWSPCRHVNYRSAAIADLAAITDARARRGRARPVGPVALRRLDPGRARASTASTSRSAARTSTSTAAPARPRTSTSGASSRTSSGNADPGLVRRSRAVRRWARASERGAGHRAAGSSGRPGSSALTAAAGGIGSSPRRASRPDPGEGHRAHGVRDRAARRLARAAGLHARLDRASRARRGAHVSIRHPEAQAPDPRAHRAQA